MGGLKRVSREDLKQEFKGLRYLKVRVVQVDVKGPQVNYRTQDGQVEFVPGDPISVKERR